LDIAIHRVEDWLLLERDERGLSAAKAPMTIGGGSALAGSSDAARIGTIGGTIIGVAAARQAWRPRGCRWR